MEGAGPNTFNVYQEIYGSLRDEWRDRRWNWVRAERIAGGASITPDTAIAGSMMTFVLVIVTGDYTIRKGGKVAVWFPTGFGGHINRRTLPVFADMDGSAGYCSRIEVRVEKEGRRNLFCRVVSVGSLFTAVEITVCEKDLPAGSSIYLTIGHDSSSLVLVPEFMQEYFFEIAVDMKGDGNYRMIEERPVLKVIGGVARRLKVTVQPTNNGRDGFPVRIVPIDEEGHNPASVHGKSVRVYVPGAEKSSVRVSFDSGPSQVVKLPDTPRQGIFHVAGFDEDRGISGLSNPVCPDFCNEGLNIYFGEIHAHCMLSDGTGTPDEYMKWARDAEHLDFCAFADHFEESQSFSMPVAEKWKITREVTERYNCDGQFVTLLGYENANKDGHRNVYFPDGDGILLPGDADGGRTGEELFRSLHDVESLIIPHHSKFLGQIDWHYEPSPRERLVEIYSSWGCSEDGGKGCVRYGLMQGLRLGFTGGTDNHTGQPGHGGHYLLHGRGLTAVLCRRLTREDIYNALKSRRCYATTHPRILLDFHVNGEPMGGEVRQKHGKRIVRCRAIGEENIVKIELVRNSRIIKTSETGKLDVSFVFTDNEEIEGMLFYYVRVTQVDGNMAWSSPIWVATE